MFWHILDCQIVCHIDTFTYLLTYFLRIKLKLDWPGFLRSSLASQRHRRQLKTFSLLLASLFQVSALSRQSTAVWHLYSKDRQCPTSRKPLWRDMTPINIKSHWTESWKSAPVVSAHLVDDPTIRQPGFTLPWQQWSLLNRFRTGQEHCGACRKTWCLTDTDLCPHGETQTMSHVV